MSEDLLEFFGEHVRFSSPSTHTVRVIFAHHSQRPHQRTWRPPTDVYETPEATVIKVELAGVNPGDIVVSLSGHVLNVHGERESPSGRLCYHCMEILYGEFDVNVILSQPVDSAAIAADYVNGFLTVRLPRPFVGAREREAG